MTYIAQTWDGQDQVHDDIHGVDLDSALEIATAHANLLGYTVRIMAYGIDYCEVYAPGKAARRGTFGQTTIVSL